MKDKISKYGAQISMIVFIALTSIVFAGLYFYTKPVSYGEWFFNYIASVSISFIVVNMGIDNWKARK